MKKVLLTATVQSHICQFHKPLVQMLHEHGVEVHVAARNNLAEKNGLALDFVDKVYDLPFSRSPRSKDNIKAYKMLKKIIDEGEYDVVHCNTPMGGIVTRLAARKARKRGTKVFYTAHGFHFYKGAPKKNWLIFYPIEKFFANHYTDKLITIVTEDYKLASSKFKCDVRYIHGVGVDEKRYHPIDEAEKKRLRELSGLTMDDYVIICTGELNDNKNQITLLKAVNEIKNDIPNLKVLLAGNGKNEGMLKQYCHDNGLDNIVRFLGYRKDLELVVPMTDLVVSCSKREGLPLNIVEAMLCKKPVVASFNRGHNELLREAKDYSRFISGDYEVLAKALLKNKALCDTNEIEKMYSFAVAYGFDAVKKELGSVYDIKTILGREI